MWSLEGYLSARPKPLPSSKALTQRLPYGPPSLSLPGLCVLASPQFLEC